MAENRMRTLKDLIRQLHLDELNRKIKEEGFSNRVKIVKCSLFEMDFPDTLY